MDNLIEFRLYTRYYFYYTKRPLFNVNSVQTIGMIFGCSRARLIICYPRPVAFRPYLFIFVVTAKRMWTIVGRRLVQLNFRKFTITKVIPPRPRIYYFA